MPIGKNSLKRVANNGYSNVKTAAPDMENSTEIKEKSKVIEENASLKEAKPAPKKAAKPGTPAKEQEISEKTSSYINIGADLPIYLL